MINVIIGDLHGHDIWKKIVEKEPICDKIIFLGDYIDSYTIDTDTQYNNLLDILQFKEDNPDKVILLRGNHDLNSGMGYSWAECSGYNPQMNARFPRDRFMENTQWVYIEDKVIYSHAGVSSVWLDNVKLESPEEINDLPPTEVFGFWRDSESMEGLMDVYGTSKTQGPVWIRPQTLAQYAVEGYDQVVGHTCVRHEIVNLKQAVKGKQNIWLCDSLHLHQYLKMVDGDAQICRFED